MARILRANMAKSVVASMFITEFTLVLASTNRRTLAASATQKKLADSVLNLGE